MNIKHIFAIGALALTGVTSVQADDDIIAKGEEIFLARCEYCHGGGPYRPGTIALGRRYEEVGIPGPLAERTNLTPELIELFVRTDTPSMAPVRKTEINDEELGWLVAYLTRNNP